MARRAGFDRDGVLLIEAANPQPSDSGQRDRRTIRRDRQVSLAERKRPGTLEEGDHYMNRRRRLLVARSCAGEPQHGAGEDASRDAGGDPRGAADSGWAWSRGALVGAAERILEEDADIANVLHPPREILLEAALDDPPRQRRRAQGQRRVIRLQSEHTRQRFGRRL